MKQQVYEQMLADIKAVVSRSMTPESALSGILEIHKIVRGKEPFCEKLQGATKP
jgi:hypothetical protein